MILGSRTMRLFLLASLPLFFACNAKPSVAVKKPVNFETIRPKAQTKAPQKDSIPDTTRSELKRFEHDSLNMYFDSLSILEDLHFLNRFTEINRGKRGGSAKHNHWIYWRLYDKKRVIDLRKWDFADSLTRSNAFYNWIDNFGEERLSFKRFEPVKLGPKNLFILVNATSILSIESESKIDKSKWEMYQKIYYPKDSTVMEIYQTPKKPCFWYIKDENGKFKPIEIPNDPSR